MNANFTFRQGHADGFDWFYPPWLMVGASRHRHVELLDGPGLHVHSTNPEVATAHFTDPDDSDCNNRVVSVTGHSRGSARIEARHGHHVKAVLHVGVYPTRKVKVNFYRVKDGGGNVPVFNTSMVKGLTETMNHLHHHQTNLVFESHLLQDDVHVNLDFSTPNQGAQAIKHIWDVLTNKARELDNSSGHYHVFWVKTWGAKDSTCNGVKVRNVLGTASDIGGHLCVMEDMNDTHKQGLLLTHELGHCLKAHHDQERESALMYPRLSGGRKLYRHAVEEMRGVLSES